jgi:hypothetical protein
VYNNLGLVLFFYILVKGLCSILVEGDGVGERLNGIVWVCGRVGGWGRNGCVGEGVFGSD